ncbi:SDR family NAD(P)-dependent oxidoreductase [Candidatus Pelagibacter sp.]|nr:SDR family NAD(P)-dependent oxidoreductase [Candidatus Pelagibacter sp.]
MKKILITGAAGFIGFHTCLKLLELGKKVIGIDNLNNYYDPNLKRSRLKILQKSKNFTFKKINLQDEKKLKKIFQTYKIEKVLNLAAQAGVRYSLINPKSYIDTNLVGFFNLIDLSRKYGVKHFVYASTSSVYGFLTKMPFKEDFSTDHPIQLYAATKKSNELIAHSYSHIYKLPTTGLRFFTVYGPWGRPDMALFKFTKNILSNKKIEIFNYGNHSRDFTYIDDIVQGIVRSINKIPKSNKSFNFSKPKLAESSAPFTVYNIGNGKKVKLMKYVSEIEKYLNKDAKKNYKQLQKGDIKDTHSNLNKIKRNLGYKSKTPVEKGVKNFLKWYLEYYKIKK